MKENYPKAYTEVLEILKYMPEEDVKKIPKDMLDMFNLKKDTTYIFEINEKMDFSKIEVLEETEAIFINIFRDYWATEEQKIKIINKQNEDRKAIEQEKREKCNFDNLFKKKEDNLILETEEEKNNNNFLLEIKEKNILEKIIEKIKRFFGIN